MINHAFNRMIYKHIPKNCKKSNAKSVLFLHGFLGSKSNWISFTSLFNKKYGHETYSLDAPNHGDNIFNDIAINYNTMKNYVKDFALTKNLVPLNLIGHSMGGKTSCYLALNHPMMVESLVVLDIPPCPGSKKHLEHNKNVLKVMRELDLDQYQKISDIRTNLLQILKISDVVELILSNIKYDYNLKRFLWKININLLQDSLEDIFSFPYIGSNHTYDGPSLFIKGEYSNYLTEDHFDMIKRYFPKAEIIKVKDCGHLLHIHKREILVDLIDEFLMKNTKSNNIIQSNQ